MLGFENGAPQPGAVWGASESTRGAFLMKTYGLLLASIFVFLGLETLWFVTPVASTLLSLIGSAGRFS